MSSSRSPFAQEYIKLWWFEKNEDKLTDRLESVTRMQYLSSSLVGDQALGDRAMQSCNDNGGRAGSKTVTVVMNGSIVRKVDGGAAMVMSMRIVLMLPVKAIGALSSKKPGVKGFIHRH
jgi:hypothetical protein